MKTTETQPNRKMSHSQQELAELVFSYRNDNVIRRFMKDNQLTEEASVKVWHETMRFMFLAASHNEPLAPSHLVDEMWHTFLLFTRDYREFCDAYFDYFIDHCPLETPATEAYKRTKELLVYYFDAYDEEIWAVASEGTCRQSCNDGGTRIAAE